MLIKPISLFLLFLFLASLSSMSITERGEHTIATSASAYDSQPLKLVSFESGNDDATSSNLGALALNGAATSFPYDFNVPSGCYRLWYFPKNSSYTFVRWEASPGITLEDSTMPETVANITNSGIIKAVYAGPASKRIYRQQIEVSDSSFSTLNTPVGSIFHAEISVSNWSIPAIYSYQLKVWYDNTLLEAINTSIPPNHFLEPKLDPENILVMDSGTINQAAGCVSFAMSLRGGEQGSTGSGVLATVAFRISTAPPKGENRSCTLRLQGVVLADAAAIPIPSNLYLLSNGRFLYEWMTFETDFNRDGTVNIQDIALVAVGYGSKAGDPKWNLIADLDKNGIINIVDVTMVAKDYGRSV